MSLEVTLDKHDMVLEVKRPAGETRWRFKRTNAKKGPNPGKLSDERAQEVLAWYVDNSNLPVGEICKAFEIDARTLYRLMSEYGVKPRQGNRDYIPKPRHNHTPTTALAPAGDPVLATIIAGEPALQEIVELPPAAANWRVFLEVVQVVTRELHAESLAELERHASVRGERIVRIERI